MLKNEFADIENFWKEFTTGRRQRTIDIALPPNQIDKLDQLEFSPGENYLNITVNEVWLSIKVSCGIRLSQWFLLRLKFCT